MSSFYCSHQQIILHCIRAKPEPLGNCLYIAIETAHKLCVILMFASSHLFYRKLLKPVCSFQLLPTSV